MAGACSGKNIVSKLISLDNVFSVRPATNSSGISVYLLKLTHAQLLIFHT